MADLQQLGHRHLPAAGRGSELPAAGRETVPRRRVWPAVARDETVVEHLQKNARLELTAKGRPLGEAKVIITVTETPTGTSVTINWTPTAGPGKWSDNPLLEKLLTRRNIESLACLAALTEHRTHPGNTAHVPAPPTTFVHQE